MYANTRTRAGLAVCALTTLAALGLATAPAAHAQATDANGNAYYIPGSPTSIGSVRGTALLGEDVHHNTSDPNTHQPYNVAVGLGAGGSVGGAVYTFNDSTFSMTGGTVGGFLDASSGAISVSGGTVGGDPTSAYPGSAVAQGYGRLTITGGTFDGGVEANDYSQAAVGGGTFGSDLAAEFSSSLSVSGGTISGGVDAETGSTVRISGGTFGVFSFGQGNPYTGINFYDGDVYGGVYEGLPTSGSLTFVGTGLTAFDRGADPNYAGEDYVLGGTLQNGQSVNGDVVDVKSGAPMFGGVTFVSAPPGSSQANPRLPDGTSMSGGQTVFTFHNVSTHSWVDPATATAFRYAMTGVSLFTGISGFPTGFGSPFDVSANGKDYGLFSPGQSVAFDGAGVSSFLVSGIDPAMDGSSPTAFPLQVDFNTPTADFTMAAAPEPSQSAALALGALGVTILTLRARRRRATF